MVDQSIQDRYFRLLKAYVSQPDEKHLFAAAELGRELVLADVPPEEIVELHEEALHRLAQAFPDMTLLDTARLISTPLMELLMAYGLTYRERLETRRQSETALHRRTEELQAVFDTTPIPLFVVDSDRRIQQANKAAQAFCDLPEREMIGQRPGQALHCLHYLDAPEGCGFGPQCQTCIARNTVLETFRTRQPTSGIETDLILQIDGQYVPRAMRLGTAHFESQAGPRVVVALEDITGRKRTEATWRALNAASAAVQQAGLSEAEIYQAATGQLAALGFRGAITLLDEATDTFVFEHIFVPAGLLRALERLTGLTTAGFRFPRARVPAYAQVAGSGQAVYVADSPGQIAVKLVPESVSRLAGRVAEMVGRTSAILAPLRVEDRVMGVLHVGSAWLTEADVPAITAFADQLSAALENARLHEAERQRTAELARANNFITALSQVAARIEAASDPDGVMETLGAELKQLGLTCFVALLEPDDQALVIRYVSLESAALALVGKLIGLKPRGFRMTRERWTYFSDVVERGRAVFLTDALSPAIALVPGFARPVVERAIRSAGVTPDTPAILLPLRVGEQVAGVLGMWGQDLREADLPAAATFASQVAMAIERARLFDEARRRAEELATLQTTGRAITSLDLDAVLETIASQARTLFQADGSRIHLVEPDGETLRCVTALHERAEAIMAVRPKLGQGFTGRVALKGVPELIPNTLANSQHIQVPGTPVEPEAVALAPLKIREQVIGVMTVTRLGEDRPFNPSDLALLSAFANQAAVAIQNARLYDETRRRAAELEALAEVSSALRAARTTEEMVPVFLRKAIEVVGGTSGAIFLVEPGTGDLVIQSWHPPGFDLADLRHRPREGITAHVAATREIHISEDLAHDPLAHVLPQEASHLSAVRSNITLPLRTQEHIVGVMHIALDEQRAFTDNEVHLLTAIAEMAGNALQRATLHEQTQQRLQRLVALRHIDLAITASMDLRITLNILLDQVTAQLGVDAADVLLLDAETLTLEYAAGRGFRSTAIQRSPLRLGEGLAGRAALERQTISDFGMRISESEIQRLAGEDFAVYYGVPLIARGQVKGVLEIFHRAPLTPDPDWLEFLEALAGQAAIAIDNATLFDDLQRSNLELALAYDTTLEGWARALELGDVETEGHSQCVTEMTLRLARAMGMSEEALVHVRRGTLLHDIGKMAVPDRILLKPGPLTDEEWDVVRQHPVHTHELLAPIAHLRPALDIPCYHHERWDGTGYPQGLKGAQIPLAARVFAVVDVWDALLSERPYRDAWPEEKVRAYIREQAGKQFDPRVVEVFMRSYNAINQ